MKDVNTNRGNINQTAAQSVDACSGGVSAPFADCITCKNGIFLMQHSWLEAEQWWRREERECRRQTFSRHGHWHGSEDSSAPGSHH